MRRLLCRVGLLLIGIAAWSAITSAAESGFLERRGTELYLDGKPFYEISFNKFDLVWQLVAAESKTKGFGEDPASSAEEALREMHELDFKTFRAFCGMPAHYFDTAKRDTYFRALDRMLALCDGYDLRVVFCLNVTGCVAKDHGETLVDLVARPESASRRRLEEFVRAVVTRYRYRKAVGMWEHENELLLMADIGGKQRLWNGQAVPTLPEVAKFHADLAALIRTVDPHHLITTGDSFRYSQWHLYQAIANNAPNAWQTDTLEELGRAIGMCQKPVDVYCVHYYEWGRKNANMVTGPDGQATSCTPAAFTQLAKAQGQPCYIGEYGVLPMPRSEKEEKFWAENPGWFTSFEQDPQRARQAVKAALEVLVEGRPSLAHWWCYQSNRDMDQRNPQRMDIDLQRDPDLTQLVVDANRRLQMQTMGFSYVPNATAEKARTPNAGAAPKPSGTVGK